MKKKFFKIAIMLIAISFGISASTTSPTAKDFVNQGKHLFILSGQSNMVRMDETDVFIPRIEREFGENNVIFVKHAAGGTSIQGWYKEWADLCGSFSGERGYVYDELMGKVFLAIEDEAIESVTFVWMQGERDTVEAKSFVYRRSLLGLIDQISTDLNRSDINFVIGRLSDVRKSPEWLRIRFVQRSVSALSPNYRLVNTDDLNDFVRVNGDLVNGLHYTPEGYRLLGRRFALEAIDIIQKRNE